MSIYQQDKESGFKTRVTIKARHSVVYSYINMCFNTFLNKLERQYNSAVHILYNDIVDRHESSTKKTKKIKYTYDDAKQKLRSLNNLDLIKSYYLNSVLSEANSLYKKHNVNTDKPLGHKLVFGGKSLFLKRAKGLISKEEFIKERLMPIMVIGEANKGGNGRFKIRSHRYIDMVDNGKTLFTFRLTDKRCGILGKLKALQDNEEVAITYRIDEEYIYITYDASLLEDKKHDVFTNRLMSLDLNPGCIGVTISDIDLEDECNLKPKFAFAIDWNEILKKHIDSKSSSDSEISKYYNNKRIHEIKEVDKLIYQLAVQYNCRFIVCEDLEFKNPKGRKMANLWNRDLTIKSLQSKCDRNNIKLLTINPAFTSKLGNILCKNKIPDMCRSAFEIGYRAYRGIENGNFLIEKKETDKKLGQDRELYIHGVDEFKNFIIKSLEERGDKVKSETLEKIKGIDDFYELNKILNSYNIKYRVSMKECESNDTVYIYKTGKSFIKIHSYKIDNEELNYLVS